MSASRLAASGLATKKRAPTFCSRAAKSIERRILSVRSDRLLVKRVDEAESKKGGIIIPDTAKEKPLHAAVVAVGPGRMTEEGKRLTMDVKKGDKILIGKYSGTEVKIEGDEFVILREDDVLAVIA
jgi:chaperonin GroES